MKLSVIVVNQNACKLLKQALNSLTGACKNIDFELFVVDNASTDGSLEMIENSFPKVRVIANTTNQGMAPKTANNQALRLSTGEYVFLVMCGYNLRQGFIGKDDYLYG